MQNPKNSSTDESLLGSTIGKYQLHTHIGSGGMGHVFLARHITMKRWVAIKVLPQESWINTSAIARFEREARAAAALSHANILHAYDFDQEGDLLYMVMEFIDGTSIHEYIQRFGVMYWAHAADIIAQAAAALEHAHKAGLVHRDIKPANIMLDVNGLAKVLDLGLAVFTAERGKDSITAVYDDKLLGTADYLAPEQAMDSQRVDCRTDIYSLGCTYYYMLCGEAPFSNLTMHQKLLAHQMREPQPLRERVSELPDEIDVIIRKMMAKDPQERFQTPAEVETALRPHAVRLEAPFGLGATKVASFWHNAHSVTGSGVHLISHLKSTSGSDVARPDNHGKPAKPQNVRTNNSYSNLGGSQVKPNPNPSPTLADYRNHLSNPGGSSRIRVHSLLAKHNDLDSTHSGKQVTGSYSEEVDGKSGSRTQLAIFWGIGVSIMLILGITVYFILNNFTNSLSNQADNPTPTFRRDSSASSTVEVSKKPTGIADLREGLRRVAAAGTVRIDANNAEWLQSRIEVDVTVALKDGVTLMGASPSTVITMDDLSGPIVRITAANHFTIQDLIFNGSGREGPLLEVYGDDIGFLHLKNLTFRNFIGPAIRVINVTGNTNAAKLTFSQLKIESKREKSRSLIEVHNYNTSEPTLTKLSCEGCQFSGFEVKGVEINQFFPTISFKDCSFSDGQTGVVFDFKTKDTKATIRLENNKFSKLNQGVQFIGGNMVTNEECEQFRQANQFDDSIPQDSRIVCN